MPRPDPNLIVTATFILIIICCCRGDAHADPLVLTLGNAIQSGSPAKNIKSLNAG